MAGSVEMTRGKTITLGVFTALPLLYIIFFMVFFIGTFVGVFTSVISNEIEINNEVDIVNKMFLIIFPIHFAVFFGTMVLLVIYIVDVFRNKNIKESERILWLLVLLFGSLIAMPVYWYINISRYVLFNRRTSA
jgi:hypothetical protein